MPPKAGCAEIDVFGTRSSGAPAAVGLAAVDVAVGSRERRLGHDGLKMVEELAPGRVGRRLGNEEKALLFITVISLKTS